MTATFRVDYENGIDLGPGETAYIEVDPAPELQPLALSILIDGTAHEVLLKQRVPTTDPSIVPVANAAGSSTVDGRRVKFVMGGTPTPIDARVAKYYDLGTGSPASGYSAAPGGTTGTAYTSPNTVVQPEQRNGLIDPVVPLPLEEGVWRILVTSMEDVYSAAGQRIFDLTFASSLGTVSPQKGIDLVASVGRNVVATFGPFYVAAPASGGVSFSTPSGASNGYITAITCEPVDGATPLSTDAPPPVFNIYAAAANHVTSKVPYDGLVVASVQYPFIDIAANPDPAITVTSVDWYLDQAIGAVIYHTDTVAPYFDFNGSTAGIPIAWDTTTVSGSSATPVAHVLRARVHLSDGTHQDLAATVTVENAVSTFNSINDTIYDFTNTVYRTNPGWTHFGKHEKFPSGVPTGYDWYEGARFFVQPATWCNAWCMLFDPAGGGPQYDVRGHCRRFVFRKYVAGTTNNWVTMFTSDVIASNGGYWNGTFGGTGGVSQVGSFGSYGGVRTEASGVGGGTSIPLHPLNDLANCDVAHFWPNYGTFFDIHDALAIEFTGECRLIHDVSGAVDLSFADFYFSMGTDVMAGAVGTSTNLGGPTQSRMRKADYAGHGSFDGWKTFSVSNITAAGCTAIGIPTSPSADQLADGVKAFLVAHSPPLQTYP